MDKRQLAAGARVVAGIMLLLALGSREYYYYQILRVVVCAAAAILVWYFFEKKQSGWALAFMSVAILFNPVTPIYLAKETWQATDLFAGILFFASFSAESKKK